MSYGPPDQVYAYEDAEHPGTVRIVAADGTFIHVPTDGFDQMVRARFMRLESAMASEPLKHRAGAKATSTPAYQLYYADVAFRAYADGMHRFQVIRAEQEGGEDDHDPVDCTCCCRFDCVTVAYEQWATAHSTPA